MTNKVPRRGINAALLLVSIGGPLLAQADVQPLAPLTRMQLMNGGWMEHTAGLSPIYATSVDELPQLACQSKPVVSFVPHPTVPYNWYYDCLNDPWGPLDMWVGFRSYCPSGYTLSADGQSCVADGSPNLPKNLGGSPSQCPLAGNPVNVAGATSSSASSTTRMKDLFPFDTCATTTASPPRTTTSNTTR